MITSNDLRIRFARNVEQMRDTANLMPGSRERALVLTKIDEAELWAIKAIPEGETPTGNGLGSSPDAPNGRFA